MAEPTIAVPVSTMRKIAEQLKVISANTKSASDKAVNVQPKVVETVDVLIKAGAYGQADREALTRDLCDHVRALDILSKTASKVQPRRLGSVTVEPTTKKQASVGNQNQIDENWLKSVTA